MDDASNAGVSKGITLVVTSITGFVTTIMMSSVSVATPTIGREFAMEAVLLGWVVTSMTFPQVAILLSIGRLADIYGRKKVFLYGMVLFAISSLLCGLANSAVTLISFRVIQGIGSGMVFGTQMAILTSVFPGKERGRAFGISAAVAFLGLSIGPFWGGVLTQHLGWRSIFYLNAFLCLVSVVLIIWKLKGEWAEARGERFDVAGGTVFGISIVLMMYGFTKLTTFTGMIIFAAGLLGLLIFIRLEARTDSPIFNIGLFRKNTIFVFSNLTMLIHFCTVSAVTFLMSVFLQYIKGFTPQTAGLIMLAQPICMTIFAPIAGRFSDKIEPRIVAAVGMVFTCVALVFYIFLTEETALGFIIAALIIMGIGVGIFASPNANAVMSSVERKYLGVASGTQGTMRSGGQVLGLGIVMIIFSIFIGAVEITPEYYTAFMESAKAGFIIFAALCFGGIFSQLIGKKATPE